MLVAGGENTQMRAAESDRNTERLPLRRDDVGAVLTRRTQHTEGYRIRNAHEQRPLFVYALGDTCSHDEVSLSEGCVDADDRSLECRKHGAQFDLTTGEPLTLPATRPVPTYEVEVVDGRVLLTVEPDEENAR